MSSFVKLILKYCAYVLVCFAISEEFDVDSNLFYELLLKAKMRDMKCQF